MTFLSCHHEVALGGNLGNIEYKDRLPRTLCMLAMTIVRNGG